MDLRLSEDQELIRSTARDFLKSECPMELVRALEDDPKGYSGELWRKMAELDLMGVAFSEEYGGAGQGFLELCVLIEEQGRACLPSPFFSTVVLCGLPIARFGTDAQKQEFLNGIASGQRILAYAGTESAWRRDCFTATADGKNYVLEGEKLFVPYAHVASDILIAADSKESAEDGILLFLVDAKTPGITCQPLQTVGGERQGRVILQGVRVPEERLLGRSDPATDILQAIQEWGARREVRRNGRGGAAGPRNERCLCPGPRSVRPPDWNLPGRPAPLRQHGRGCGRLAVHRL